MSEFVLMLSESAKRWGMADFKQVLKHEIERLDHHLLPLQKGLSISSVVSPEPFQVMVISAGDQGDLIEARIGIFYQGIIAGCNCADDPTPVDTENEYCEITVSIGKKSGKAEFNLAG